jgi:hypothetical protein
MKLKDMAGTRIETALNETIRQIITNNGIDL